MYINFIKLNFCKAIKCYGVQWVNSTQDDTVHEGFPVMISNTIHLGWKWMFCFSNIEGFLQIKYSPRRVPGFGLTDGEVLERLWSFLRRFGKMTKEMRPNHRVDVLSDALLFYARKRSESLGLLFNSNVLIQSTFCHNWRA